MFVNKLTIEWVDSVLSAALPLICWAEYTATRAICPGPYEFSLLGYGGGRKHFWAKYKLVFWNNSNDSNKLQVKYCQSKEDFSLKWLTLVSFLIVSTGSSQSKILPRYLGYVLVCLSLAYTHNNKSIWKSNGGKVILALCDLLYQTEFDISF